MCVVLIIVYNFLVNLFQDISEFKKILYLQLIIFD